ncbi:MAG: hypothetical protein WBF52_06965, partial [Geitlerinemataceae cyanobacterium]
SYHVASHGSDTASSRRSIPNVNRTALCSDCCNRLVISISTACSSLAWLGSRFCAVLFFGGSVPAVSS